METISANHSQYDFPHGASSCTSAAVLFARYSLEKVPGVDDLDKILEAGALLWQKWKSSDPNAHCFQTWKNVVDTFPRTFAEVEIIHESNGYIGTRDLPPEEFLFTTVEECIEKMHDNAPCSAVITCASSSFALCFRDEYYYFFDSHGCSKTNGNAYILRMQTRGELEDFVQANLSHVEFTALIIQKQTSCRSDT